MFVDLFQITHIRDFFDEFSQNRYKQKGMRIIAVFATLLSVATLAVAITSPPSFCNGLDCPLWNTNSTCTGANGTFEIRQYPAYKWVSYNIEQYSYNGATSSAFMHLFNYLQGTGVKMTALCSRTSKRALARTATAPSLCRSSWTSSTRRTPLPCQPTCQATTFRHTPR